MDFRILSVLWIALFVSYSRVSSESSSEISIERIPTSVEIDDADLDDKSEEEEDDDGGNSPKAVLQKYGKDKVLKLISKLRALTKLKNKIAKEMSWKQFLAIVKKSKLKSTNKKKSILKTVQSKQTNSANTEKAISSNSSNLNKKGIDPTSHISKKERINSQSTPSEISSPVVAKPIETGSHTSSSTGTSQPQKLPSMIPSRQSQTSNASPIPPASIISSFTLTKNKPAFSSMSNTHTTEEKPAGEVFKEQSVSTTKQQNAPSIPVFKSLQNINQNVIPAQSDVKSRFLIKAPTNAPTDHSAHTSSRMGQKDITSQTHHASSMVPTLKSDPKPVFIPKIIAPTAVFSINKHESKATQLNAGTRSNHLKTIDVDPVGTFPIHKPMPSPLPTPTTPATVQLPDKLSAGIISNSIQPRLTNLSPTSAAGIVSVPDVSQLHMGQQNSLGTKISAPPNNVRTIQGPKFTDVTNIHDIGVVNEQKSSVRNFASAVPSKENSQVKITTTVESATVSVPFIVVNPTPLTTKFTFSVVKPSIRQSTSFKSTKVQTSSSVDTPASAQLPSMTSDKNPSAVVDTSHVVDNGLVASSLSGHSMPNNLIKSQKVKPTIHKPTKLVPTTINIDSKLAPNINVKASRLPSGHKRTKMLLNRLVMLRRRILALRRQKQMEELSAERMRTEKIRAAASAERLRKAHRLKASAEKMRKAKKRASFSSSSGSAEIDDSGENSGSAESHVTAKYNEAKRLQRMKKAITKILQLSKQGRLKLSTKALKLIAKWIRIIKRQGKKVHSMPMQQRNRVVKVSSDKSNIATSNLSSVKDKTAAMSVTDTDNINTIKSKESMQTNTNTASAVSPQTHNIVHTANSLNNPISVVDPTSIPVHANDASVSRLEMHPVKKQSFEVFSLKKAKSISSTKASSLVDSNKPGGVIIRKGQGQAVDIPKTSASSPINNEGLIHPSQPQGGSQSGILQEKGIDLSISQHSVGGKIPSASGTSNSITNSKTLEQSPETNNNIVGFIQDKNTAGTESSLSSVSNVFSKQDIKSKIPGKQGQESANSILKFDSSSSVKGIPIPLDTPSTLKSSLTAQVSNAAPDSRTEIAKFRARESRRLRTTLQRLAMARKLRQQLLEKRNQNGLSDSSAEHIAKNSIINNSPSSKSFIFKSHQTFTNQNSIRRKRRKRSVKKEETEIADKNLRKRRHLGGFGSPGGVFVDGSLNQLGFQNFMGPKNQPNILGGIPIQMNGGLVSPREVSNMIMSNPSNQGNFFVPPYKRKSSSYDKKKPTNTYEKRNQNNIVNNLSSLGNFRPGSGGGGIPLFVANNEVPNVEQGGFIVQQMQPPQMSQPSLQQQHIHQRNLQQQMIQQELQQQQLQREIQQQQLQQELQQQQMQREIHQQQIQQELQQQQIQREIQQQQLQQELQRQQLQQQQIHISQTMNLAQQLPPGTQLPNINLNQLSQQSPQPKKSYATNSLNNFNAPPNVKRIHIHRQIGNYEKKDPSSYDKPAGGLSQARVGLSSGNAVESYAVRDSYPKVNTHLHNKVATQHSVVHSTLGAPQQQMMVQQQLGAVPQHMHGQEVTVHVEPAVSRPVIIDQQRNHQPKFIQISKQIQSLRPVDVHQSLNQPVHHMQEHSLQQPHRHETVLHEHHEPSVHNQLNMHHHHHEHTVHHQHQEPTVHHQHQEPSVHHHHEPTVHHQHQEPSMHHHHEPKVHHHHQEPSVHHHHEPTVHHHHHHHHHQEPVIHHEPSLHQPHPDHIVHKGLHLPPPPPHMMPPPPPPPQPIVVVEEPPPPPPQPIVVVEEPPVMMNNIHSHPSESVAGQLLSGAPVMTQSLGDFGAGSLGGGIGIGMRGGAFNQGQLQPAIQIPANIVKEPVQLPPPATLTNNMRPSTGILDNQQQVFVDRPVQNQGLSSGGQNPGFGSVLSATPFIGTGEQYGGGVSVDLFDAHNHASEGWDPPMKVKQTSEAKKDIKGVQDLQKPKKAEPIIDGVIGGSTLSNSLDKPSASLSRMHAAIQNEIFNFVPKSIAKDAKFTAAAYEKKVDAYEKKALANEQQAEAYDKKMDVYANTLESYDKAAQAEQGTYDKVPESNQYDKQSHSLSYDKHMTKPETVEYNPPQPDVVQSQVIVDYNPQEPSPIYTQPPEPTMVSQGPSEPARVQYSPPGQYEGFVVGDPYKLSEYVQTPKPPQRLKPEKVNPTEGIPVSYNSMEKNKLSGPFIQDKFSQQMPPSGDMAGSLFNSWANEQRNREPPSTPPPPPPIVAPGDRYGPVEPSNPTQQQYTGSSLSQRLTQPTRGPNNFQGAIESPMLNNEHKRFNEKQQALNSLNSPARDVPYFKEKYQSSNSLAAPSSNAQSFQERQKSYNVMNSPPSDISYFQEKYQSSNSLNAPNPNAQGFIEQIQGSNSLNSPQRDVPYFQEKYQSSNSLNTPDQNAQGFLEKFQASNTLNSPPRDVPFSQENFQSSNSLNAPDKNTQGFIEKIQSSNSLNSPQKYRSSNSLTAPQHAHPSHEKHQGSFSLNSPPRDVPYFEEKFQSSNSLTAPHPDTKHQRPHSLNSPPRDVPYFQETYQGSNSKKPPNSDIPLFNSGYSGGLSGMLSQRPSDSNFNSLSPSYKGQQLAFTVDNPTNKEKITPKNQKQETKVNPFNNAAGGLIVSDRSSQGLSFGGGSLSSIGKDFSGGTANSNYQLSSNMQQPQTENLSEPPRGGAVVFSDKNFLGESGGNSHHSPSRDSAKLSLSGSYIGNHLRAGYLSQGSRTYQEPPPNVNYNNKGDSQRYSLSAGTVA